jgi:hypothetical protein
MPAARAVQVLLLVALLMAQAVVARLGRGSEPVGAVAMLRQQKPAEALAVRDKVEMPVVIEAVVASLE